MRVLGTIVRLQVQASSLKVGDAPRRYDPSPLQVVHALTVTPGGVIGVTGEADGLIDVHHQEHPRSKNSGGKNGISLGFTSHYDAMREEFGPHLSDGIAGENALIELADDPRLIAPEELAGGVTFIGDGRSPLALERVIVAAPCVEFSRFALRFPNDRKPDATVTEALRFLGSGMRGFYGAYEGEPAVLRVGDRLAIA
jgi:hypothetical protein